MKLINKPMPNPDVILKKITDVEAILINLDTTSSIKLNWTGFKVWSLINGLRTISEIISKMERIFPDAPPEMPDDIQDIIKVLKENGFVGYEYQSR